VSEQRRKFRFVVVGYGMGAWHARLIRQVEGLELYGICDIDPAKREKAASDHPDAKIFDHFDQVLADDSVDAVSVVTPHNQHARMAIQSMDAGKHTLTDKAMCLTTDEARAMIAARDRNRVLLSVFHNRRWDSDFVTVRKVVEEGLLGHVFHIQSNVTYWGTPGGWRNDRPQMGGWLFDWGAHTIDQILLLEPSRPKHVYAFDHYRHEGRTSVEDYINLTITFESGLTASTVISYIHRSRMPRWHIIGQDGALTAEDFDKPLTIRKNLNGLDSEITIPLFKADWKSFYENISGTLANREELNVKPEQILPQIAISQAAYRSIESQQVVPVERTSILTAKPLTHRVGLNAK